MRKSSEMLLWRLAKTLTRLGGRIPKAVLASVRQELEHLEKVHGDAKDIFDEMPDPPHLESGEVKHYGGKLRYFDE